MGGFRRPYLEGREGPGSSPTGMGGFRRPFLRPRRGWEDLPVGREGSGGTGEDGRAGRDR